MGLERLLSEVVRGWLDKADLDRGSGNRHDSLCHAVRILNSRVDELEAKLKPESEHAEDAANYATGGCYQVVMPEADKTPEAKPCGETDGDAELTIALNSDQTHSLTARFKHQEWVLARGLSREDVNTVWDAVLSILRIIPSDQFGGIIRMLSEEQAARTD